MLSAPAQAMLTAPAQTITLAPLEPKWLRTMACIHPRFFERIGYSHSIHKSKRVDDHSRFYAPFTDFRHARVSTATVAALRGALARHRIPAVGPARLLPPLPKGFDPA